MSDHEVRADRSPRLLGARVDHPRHYPDGRPRRRRPQPLLLATAMTSCHGAYYDGVLRIICTADPEVVLIAGEIDAARYLGLVSTLEDLVDSEGDVHVNLAELEYCDLAGLRAILRLAGTGREDPDHNRRSLFLDDVPPHLATLLQTLGWDSTPGLIMNEPTQPAAGPSGMEPAGLVSGDVAMALAASGSAPGSG